MTQVISPTVVVVPFTTLDPDADHRFKGLFIATANIQGTNCYLCHDKVFRNSALPMDSLGLDRQSALTLPESAYYESLDEIATMCEQVGLSHNLKATLPTPKEAETAADTEERERIQLKELLAKYGNPDGDPFH